MCVSDEKFKKKFEGKSFFIKKLLMLKDKSNELKLELYSDSYVKLQFDIQKLEDKNVNILHNKKGHSSK